MRRLLIIGMLSAGVSCWGARAAGPQPKIVPIKPPFQEVLTSGDKDFDADALKVFANAPRKTVAVVAGELAPIVNNYIGRHSDDVVATRQMVQFLEYQYQYAIYAAGVLLHHDETTGHITDYSWCEDRDASGSCNTLLFPELQHIENGVPLNMAPEGDAAWIAQEFQIRFNNIIATNILDHRYERNSMALMANLLEAIATNRSADAVQKATLLIRGLRETMGKLLLTPSASDNLWALINTCLEYNHSDERGLRIMFEAMVETVGDPARANQAAKGQLRLLLMELKKLWSSKDKLHKIAAVRITDSSKASSSTKEDLSSLKRIIMSIRAVEHAIDDEVQKWRTISKEERQERIAHEISRDLRREIEELAKMSNWHAEISGAVEGTVEAEVPIRLVDVSAAFGTFFKGTAGFDRWSKQSATKDTTEEITRGTEVHAKWREAEEQHLGDIRHNMSRTLDRIQSSAITELISSLSETVETQVKMQHFEPEHHQSKAVELLDNALRSLDHF